MSREQLNSLIDLLMEMDTIPGDLAREIEIASARFKAEDASEMESKRGPGVIPAADLYSSWEINRLFPEKDMLKLKGDTSVTLLLRGGERGEYFHPFDGPVTSGFGWRDSTQHNGIDIDLNKGDKVAAAFDGMVRIAKREGGFGNVVIIRHYNGLETVYGHLSKLKVKPGQVVVSGQTIGLGGSTGHSTGSHLHFEVRFKGVPINPKYLISFTDEKLLCDEITIKKTKWGLAAYPEGQKCYTVEKGDTVFEIAKRYATTTASIKQMNGFSGRIRLKPGMVINVAQ
jgi:murein DD-endopeptidase MepM/ murein hydrolase activator NlpD